RVGVRRAQAGKAFQHLTGDVLALDSVPAFASTGGSVRLVCSNRLLPERRGFFRVLEIRFFELRFLELGFLEVWFPGLWFLRLWLFEFRFLEFGFLKFHFLTLGLL